MNDYVITNRHVPELTEVTVTKTWNDVNNRHKSRPDSITVNLLSDGKTIQTVKITPDGKYNWANTFRNLTKYDDGREIRYTITEEPVKGYILVFGW